MQSPSVNPLPQFTTFIIVHSTKYRVNNRIVLPSSQSGPSHQQMIDRKCTWTATQQDQQHRRPLDMDGPGQRIDEKAGTPEPVIGPHEACVTANFKAAFAVSLEAVFADEWTNAGRCRDGSTSAMGWLSIRAPACCLRRCSSH